MLSPGALIAVSSVKASSEVGNLRHTQRLLLSLVTYSLFHLPRAFHTRFLVNVLRASFPENQGQLGFFKRTKKWTWILCSSLVRGLRKNFDYCMIPIYSYQRLLGMFYARHLLVTPSLVKCLNQLGITCVRVQLYNVCLKAVQPPPSRHLPRKYGR